MWRHEQNPMQTKLSFHNLKILLIPEFVFRTFNFLKVASSLPLYVCDCMLYHEFVEHCRQIIIVDNPFEMNIWWHITEMTCIYLFIVENAQDPSMYQM